jgi:hypothetical protein
MPSALYPLHPALAGGNHRVEANDIDRFIDLLAMRIQNGKCK